MIAPWNLCFFLMHLLSLSKPLKILSILITSKWYNCHNITFCFSLLVQYLDSYMITQFYCSNSRGLSRLGTEIDSKSSGWKHAVVCWAICHSFFQQFSNILRNLLLDFMRLKLEWSFISLALLLNQSRLHSCLHSRAVRLSRNKFFTSTLYSNGENKYCLLPCLGTLKLLFDDNINHFS